MSAIGTSSNTDVNTNEWIKLVEMGKYNRVQNTTVSIPQNERDRKGYIYFQLNVRKKIRAIVLLKILMRK